MLLRINYSSKTKNNKMNERTNGWMDTELNWTKQQKQQTEKQEEKQKINHFNVIMENRETEIK